MKQPQTLLHDNSLQLGRTNPYIGSLLDAFTLASKERVYMLFRPNRSLPYKLTWLLHI